VKASLTFLVALGALAGSLVAPAAHGEPATPPAQKAWLRAASPKPPAPVAAKPVLSPLRVGSMLALVAGLGGFAFYARRRRSGAPDKASVERLDVLSSTRLGPKAHAVVTRVSGKRLLLGVTEQSVTVLAWLDSEPPHTETAALEVADPAELSGVVGTSELGVEPSAQNPSGFLRLLRSAVGSSAVSPAEELAGTTQDDVKVSRRAATEARELIEGQAAGILRRKRAPK
jgi:flagellar biogenesis protein FliO